MTPDTHVSQIGQGLVGGGMAGMIGSGTLSLFGVDVPVVALLSFLGTVLGALIVTAPKFVEWAERKETRKEKDRELLLRERELSALQERNRIDIAMMQQAPSKGDGSSEGDWQ